MNLFSLDDSLKVVKSQKNDGIGVEIGGSSLLYSLNYRYYFVNSTKAALGMSIGAGYLFDQITRYELVSIPVGIQTDIKLKGRIYLVNKLACLFSFCSKPYPEDKETRKLYIRNKTNDGTEIRRQVEPVFSYYLGLKFNYEKIDFSFGPALLVRQGPYDKAPLIGPWGGFNIYYKF